MSIYSELSYLFKLAEELKEIRSQDDVEEETKELCKEFNEKYIDLISQTYDGDDQIFMRDGFIEIYKDLIKWSKDHCNQNVNNKIEIYEDNLKNNPSNSNDYTNINMLNNIKNDQNQNKKFQEEDKFNIKQSNNSSLNLIENNYKNNISENSHNNNINIYNINNHSNEFKINNNNNINNNICDKNDFLKQNLNLNNNNIRENNNMYEDSEDGDEEEEEEDDDDDEENKDDNDDDNIYEIEEETEEEEEEEVKVEYQNLEKDDSFNSIENNINNKNDNNINIEDGINIKNDNNNFVNIDEESDDSGKNKISKIISNLNSNKKNSDSESNEENSDSDSEVGKKESDIDDFLKTPIKDFFKSLIKEGDNSKFNSKYVELIELIKNKDKMKREYKDKIITLMCIIFPFCTMDQKRHIHDSNIDEDENEKLELYLHETLLYFDEIDNNEKYKKITEILNNIPKKYQKEKKNYNLDTIFDKNLFLNSKEELLLLYQFLVIYKSFGAKNVKNTKTFDGRFYLSHFYFLSFKIYFILTHQELYPCITNEIFDIFEKLLFMKIFYKNALTHKLEKPYIISKMKSKKMEGDEKVKTKIEYKYKYNNFILGEPKDINIEELFDKDELELNEEVIRALKYFYKIDKDKGIDLLYFSNNPELDKNKNQYNFIINIIDLVYIKRNMILHENDKFKGNLLNLEKIIMQKVSFLFQKDKKNQEGYYSKFAMNSDLKLVYFNLIEELKSKSKINLENVNFYPVGSVAEFLYKNEDDLNIFLDIHKCKTPQKKTVLHEISHYLRNNFSATKKFNKDNCIFNFKYDKINVSLIVLGNGPYIHSLLFREYALMDPRFPIVAIALKIFLKELGFKTNSLSKDSFFLDTYSFMSLLVAFLQDIINPPILPKVFSNKNSHKILIPKSIPYISELNERKINIFIDSIKYEIIHLPKIIFEKEELKKIYKEQIENNKNNLSCAEIFLHFLEFLIFYYKFDTLFVNCSLDYEGFDSMNNLINDDDDDDEDTLNYQNPNDKHFKEYFKNNYYTKRKDKEEKEIDKSKGLYFIRDPVNPFNNPASSLNNKKKNLYQNFFLKLKKGYIKLLKNGNFNCLGKDNK